jgi:hypothetical protein
MSDARWMTYRELAEAWGVSLRAAEMRARRAVKAGRWQQMDRPNKEAGPVRVLVPAEDLTPAEREGTARGTHSTRAPHADGDTAGARAPHAAPELLAELRRRLEQTEGRLAQVEALLVEQRERAARAEQQVAALSDTVQFERHARAAAEGEREAARERAAHAEGEAGELRDTMMGEMAARLAAEADREGARVQAGRVEGEAAALRDALAHERAAATAAREGQAAAEAELVQWTAGGPLARAWRALLHRRGQA